MKSKSAEEKNFLNRLFRIYGRFKRHYEDEAKLTSRLRQDLIHLGIHHPDVSKLEEIFETIILHRQRELEDLKNLMFELGYPARRDK